MQKGLKLLSDNGQIWEIKSRVVFSHIEIYKFFQNETQSPILFKFSDLEKLQESKESILENEKLNIFQYVVQNSSNSNTELSEEELLQILVEI